MSNLFSEINFNGLKPIRDVVYEHLRSAIINNQIKPGERLVEKDYAEKFNISRTPVREALRKLEIEGLVENIPRRGDVVKGIALKDIMEIFSIRQALEPLIVEAAITNMTEDTIKRLEGILAIMNANENNEDPAPLLAAFQDFHDLLITVSDLPRISAITSQLKDYLGRFRTVTLADKKRRHQAIEDHRAIMEAMLVKDYALATNLTAAHLAQARESLLKKISVSQI